MTRTYAVVIESGPRNSGAFVPDLPGCIGTGKTRDEVIESMRTSLRMHLSSMAEDGDFIPEPSEPTEYLNDPSVSIVYVTVDYDGTSTPPA